MSEGLLTTLVHLIQIIPDYLDKLIVAVVDENLASKTPNEELYIRQLYLDNVVLFGLQSIVMQHLLVFIDLSLDHIQRLVAEAHLESVQRIINLSTICQF